MGKDIFIIAGEAKSEIEVILLLSKLAKSGIENELIQSPWDLYLLFDVLIPLCSKTIGKLTDIQDEELAFS